MSAFDLSALPAGTKPEHIETAVLKLWVNSVPVAGFINLEKILIAWTEDAITAGNAPAGLVLNEKPFRARREDRAAYLRMDVTHVVANWVGGKWQNHGFSLSPAAKLVAVNFTSREHEANDYHP